MNHVDSLLTQPFSRLKLEEKLRIKELGPHQPKDFNLKVSHRRSFSCSWYEKHDWLTVSELKKRLFCFPCLLFINPSTDKTWSSIGFVDLNHFSRAAKKHESSVAHLTSEVQYKTFGSVSIAVELDNSVFLAAKRHNEQVDRNRQILTRIIDAIKFCGVHELPLRGHDEKETSSNRGVFLDLLSFLATLDNQLNEHLQKATVAKYTSSTSQNELLDCMYDVYREELYNDVEHADFLAVEADETTDISCRSQFVIILRFIKNNLPVERFLKFVDVTDRSAKGLAGALNEQLCVFKANDKLIAQAYDGAAVMSGSIGGVQTLVRSDYPNAHYVHCYAHQFNLVLKRLTDHIAVFRKFGKFFYLFFCIPKATRRSKGGLHKESAKTLSHALELSDKDH